MTGFWTIPISFIFFFHIQAEIQSQKASSKEKIQRNINDVPKTKKNKIRPFPTYLL